MKSKMKKVLLRAMLTALSVSMILCVMLMLAPQKVSAETVWGLEAANGAYVLGTGEIKDPTKVETAQGYYMDPGSYIYYGNLSGAPILWRVLDNDHDNTGAEGAMFLFSEVVLPSERFSSSWDDDNLALEVSSGWWYPLYLNGRYENTYNGSYMEQYEYAIRRFVTLEHYYNVHMYADIKSQDYDLNVYELSAIRQVTKDDSTDFMENGLGYVDAEESFTVDITENTVTFVPYGYSDIYRVTYSYTYEDGKMMFTNEEGSAVTNGREISVVLDENGIPAMMMFNRVTETSMPWETNAYVLTGGTGSGIAGSYTATRCYWITFNLNFYDVFSDDDIEGDSYTANTLENSYIFPLSVAELEKYVANYQGAPGLSAKMIHNNTFIPWILRTAFDNDSVLCDQIGYVTADGRVTSVDADTTTGVRYAFNLEKDDVVYSQLVGDKIWRLGLMEPVYSSLTDDASRFSARIVDVIKGVDGANNQVTVEYKNAIARYSPTQRDSEDEYISAMVIRNGEVRYYGTVGYAPTNNTAYNAIDNGTYQVTFDIPADFDQSAGDELYVFWERKNDDANRTSFTSNMVKMDCIHVEETVATCNSLKVCASCRKEYGSYDTDNHSGTVSWVESTTSLEHWQDCTNCDAEIGRAACTVEENCTNVITSCICGRDDLDPNGHSFSEGICTYNSNHYQEPEKVDDVYQIEEVGHLLWFAEQVNGGNADLNAKLVLTSRTLDLSGYTFTPIGTAEHPYGGTFDGNCVVIQQLTIDLDSDGVGFFGYTDGATIRNLFFESSSIKGTTGVGVVVGNAANTTIQDCYVKDSTVTVATDDGVFGTVAGITDESTSIVSCFSTTADTNYIPLTGDGNAVLTNSFYLAETANDNGGRTAEQFESGEVAYGLGESWGQTLETDTLPVFGGKKVYQHTNCAGTSVYNNNETDADIHSYNEVVEFVWYDDYTYCEAILKCTDCDNTVTKPCFDNDDRDYDNVYFAPYGRARVEYWAEVELSDGTIAQSDRVIVIVTTIKDVTAVEPITKTFDGQAIQAADMMSNTQLKYVGVPSGYREFEAYLVPTGSVSVDAIDDFTEAERGLSEFAVAAGTYDLVVIGRNNYEHQVAIFEKVVVIEVAKLTLRIDVKDRPEDGTKNIEYDVFFEEETDLHLDWLRITVAKPTDSKMGSYPLSVSIDYNPGTENYIWGGYGYNTVIARYHQYDGFKESVELTYSETVTFNILRRTNVLIEDNGWAEDYYYDGIEITYGTPVPVPTEADFKLTEGSTLKYEWYQWIGEDIYKKMNSAPVNVGDYFLRAIGTATEDYVESYIDIDFRIIAKQITVVPSASEDYETYQDDVYLWHIMDSDDPWPDVTVDGFVNGDTLESESIGISTYVRWIDKTIYTSAELRALYPSALFYRYEVRTVYEESFGTVANYEMGNLYFYAVRLLSEAATPDSLTGSWDGSAKGITITMSHPVSEQIPEGNEQLKYQVIVTDGNGREVYRDSEYDDRLHFSHTVTAEGTYTAVVQSRLWYSDNTDWQDVVTYTYTVNFIDALAEEGAEDKVTELKDVGRYLVEITTGTDPETAVTKTAEVIIFRELRVYVKETSIDLTDSGDIPFDIKNLVFEAGYLPMLGHEIVDLDFHIKVDDGKITVRGWTILNQNGVDVSDLYTVNSTIVSWRHENGGLGVIHIFDNACDATCNAYRCNFTRSPAPHTGGTATCQELAICEVCEMYYGNLDAYNHTDDATIYVPDQFDGMLHHEVHACCGGVISTEEHHADVVATCTDRAICKVCNSEGVSFGDIDPDNHSSEKFTYVSNGVFKHKVYHTCCNGFIGDQYHSGGDATCVTQAACEHCGTSYGEYDEDDHEKADEATYVADGNTHVATYPCCKAVVREEHSGGEATCTTQASCEHCGTAYGEKNAANHTSKEFKYTLNKTSRARHDVTYACCGALDHTELHSGGKSTCLAKASCQYCGTEYGTKDLSNHAKDTFIYEVNAIDPTMHDKLYACCGELYSTEEHSGGEATCQEYATCEFCGEHQGDLVDHTYSNDCDYICDSCGEQTRAMTFHKNEDGDDICDRCEEPLEENA